MNILDIRRVMHEADNNSGRCAPIKLVRAFKALTAELPVLNKSKHIVHYGDEHHTLEVYRNRAGELGAVLYKNTMGDDIPAVVCTCKIKLSDLGKQVMASGGFIEV